MRGAHSELVVTLTGDTWLPRIAIDDRLAFEFIGSSSGVGGGTALGWDATVRPYLTVNNLRLESERRLLVSVPQFSAYSISSPETVLVMLPGAVLSSGRTIATDVPMLILADGGSVAVQLEHSYTAPDGGLSVHEDVITEETTTVMLFLDGDSWAEALGEPNSTGYTDLVDGMLSDQPRLLSGWSVHLMSVPRR